MVEGKKRVEAAAAPTEGHVAHYVIEEEMRLPDVATTTSVAESHQPPEHNIRSTEDTSYYLISSPCFTNISEMTIAILLLGDPGVGRAGLCRAQPRKLKRGSPEYQHPFSSHIECMPALRSTRCSTSISFRTLVSPHLPAAES